MTWQYHDDAVWEEVDGVVYATAATVGGLLVLEDTAAEIWEVLDGATTAEVVEAMAEGSGAAAEDIGPHVETFLTELTNRGLVTDE